MNNFKQCCISLTSSSIILTYMNNNKSTTVVRQFIEQDLFYKLNQKIQLKQIEKRITRRMPRMVTKNVISTLIDPSIKNTNHPDHQIMKKLSLKEGQEKKIEPVQLKVPTKKSIRENSQLLLPKSLKQSKSRAQEQSDNRKTSQSTVLVKLPQDQEEQSNEIQQIRKIKKLQQLYERKKQLNLQLNNRNRSISECQKKNSLSECIYHHTYDYQTNILKVDEIQRQDFAQSEQKRSFLEKIKENLDKSLQNQRMQEKLALVEEQNRKNTKIVPLNKIQKIDQEEPQSQEKSQQKEINKELIQKKIKPQYKFQSSNIKSLSKDIESYLSQGIKLITLQNKIVQQNKEKDLIYQIKEESVIKEKQRSKKEKTITSQSIIYTYEKNRKKKIPSEILDQQNQENSHGQFKYFGDYQSLQLQKDNKHENQEPLTELLRKHTKKYTIEAHSERNQFHLPVLEKYRHKKDFRKRNTTQQKMVRGLDSIEINIRTPVSKPSNYSKQRQGYFSALSMNKRTESSLEEDQHKISSGRDQSRIKKQAIKQYFSNYKQQFKHRMKSISEAIKLYT